MKREDRDDVIAGLNRRQFLVLAAAVVASPKAVDARNANDSPAERRWMPGQSATMPQTEYMTVSATWDSSWSAKVQK